MTTDSTKQLLVDGLQELYYDERRLVDALEEMAEGTDDEDVRQAFTKHHEETKGHVDRLERAFDSLDEEATERTDQVLDAMLEEHDQFAAENEGEVLDRYNLATAQKTEHFEIAAYGNLTSLAGKLGYDETADLLEATLREEEHALETVSEVSEQFDIEQVASD